MLPFGFGTRTDANGMLIGFIVGVVVFKISCGPCPCRPPPHFAFRFRLRNLRKSTLSMLMGCCADICSVVVRFRTTLGAGSSPRQVLSICDVFFFEKWVMCNILHYSMGFGYLQLPVFACNPIKLGSCLATAIFWFEFRLWGPALVVFALWLWLRLGFAFVVRVCVGVSVCCACCVLCVCCMLCVVCCACVCVCVLYVVCCLLCVCVRVCVCCVPSFL